MDIRSALFLFSLLGLSVLPLAAKPPAKPAVPPPDNVIFLHDVVIGKGGTDDLHAEIAYPKGATKPLIAIIFVHGGGWARKSQKNSPIDKIAAAGFFAASVEYRLSGVAKWPAQIQDVKLAVRWLRANAEKYNIDPNHIGVWGNSAGGHLVTCLGTMADKTEYEGDGGYPGVSSAVQAVVDCYGPTDFTRPEIYTPEATQMTADLFGVSLADNPELWKSGSPLFSVKAGAPPMLLIHGDSDILVPIAQTNVFADALKKAGVPCEVLVVKNAGHTFKAAGKAKIEPSREVINQTIFAFFDKYLKPPAETPTSQ